MKGKNGASVADVESRIMTIRARLQEIYARVAVEPVGLDDVDTEVVLDLLDAAIERAEVAIFRLHPEFEDYEPDEVAEQMAALEDEHRSERSRPKDDARADLDFVCTLVALMAAGVDQIVRGRRRRVVARGVGDEMAYVIELMCFIGYVLDPQRDTAPPGDLTAAERVRWASELEQQELLLAKLRDQARDRLAARRAASDV